MMKYRCKGNSPAPLPSKRSPKEKAVPREGAESERRLGCPPRSQTPGETPASPPGATRHKVTRTAPAPQPPGRGRGEEVEGRPWGPHYLVLIKASQLLRAHVFVTSHDEPNVEHPLSSDSPRRCAGTRRPPRLGKTGNTKACRGG